MQTELLTLIHKSHFGSEMCKAHGRELLYWQRMPHDIESLASACNVCRKFQNEHQREPLISHEIPNACLYKVGVGVDIMTFINLVFADYFF